VDWTGSSLQTFRNSEEAGAPETLVTQLYGVISKTIVISVSVLSFFLSNFFFVIPLFLCFTASFWFTSIPPKQHNSSLMTSFYCLSKTECFYGGRTCVQFLNIWNFWLSFTKTSCDSHMIGRHCNALRESHLQ